MEYFIWVIFMGVMGAVGYALGASKGNGALGLLLGLLLGPLGWLIVVVVNMNKKSEDPGMVQYLVAKEQAAQAAINRAQQVRTPMAAPELKKVRVQRDGKVIGNWTVEEVRELLETQELVWEDLYFDADRKDWVQLAGHPGV